MILKIGRRELLCDSAKEQDGKITLYQGGMAIMEIVNIPDISQIETEDGEIEHVLSPLEAAERKIKELTEALSTMNK